MDGCLSLFLAPLSVFVSLPFLAFIPAVLFLVYYLARRPAAAARHVPGKVRWSLVAGLAWIGYALYENHMQQWAKTIAGAPIRVDLLLVVPVLWVLTATALWSCIAFEISASRGDRSPAKPIQPGPYTLGRNRRFVTGLAIALVCQPLLSLLLWLSLRSTSHLRGTLLGLLVIAALSFLLVQGHRWARWCLFLWFVYATLYHFIGWSSLLVTSRQDLDIFRIWHLLSFGIDVVLGGCLLLSRRLREHLDAHSFPKSTSLSPH